MPICKCKLTGLVLKTFNDITFEIQQLGRVFATVSLWNLSQIVVAKLGACICVGFGKGLYFDKLQCCPQLLED